MQDVNTCVLVCRLVADPELRALPSGQSVCSIRVAFNTSRKNSGTGQWDDVGNFVNVTVWGKQGESIARNCHKGQRVAVEGRLQSRAWDGPNGEKRQAVDIVANRVQFLEPRSQNSEANVSTSDFTQPDFNDMVEPGPEF